MTEQPHLPVSGREGPMLHAEFRCHGCRHLSLTDWHISNDPGDYGTSARCLAVHEATREANLNIVSDFYSKAHPCPEWCPLLPGRVRHVKRGSTYQLLGIAEAQVSKPYLGDEKDPWRVLKDGSRLAVYRGDDGRLWARFEDEFNDGRFERLEP